MNDISAILDRIGGEAEAYRAEVLSRAENTAKDIAAEYKTQADKASAEAALRAQAAADAVMQRAVSQSGIAERNALLSTRRSVMEEAFAQAGERLASTDSASRTALYARLAAKNISADAELILNAADRKAIGDAVLKQAQELIGGKYALTLSRDTGDFSGGLILRQGKIEANCTWEVMLSAAKESLEGEVVSVLFGA